VLSLGSLSFDRGMSPFDFSPRSFRLGELSLCLVTRPIHLGSRELHVGLLCPSQVS
jgi:hypothetical protein